MLGLPHARLAGNQCRYRDIAVLQIHGSTPMARSCSRMKRLLMPGMQRTKLAGTQRQWKAVTLLQIRGGTPTGMSCCRMASTPAFMD